jgi:hypothetical protein
MKRIHRFYWQHRKAGWRPIKAWHAAKVRVKWDALESCHAVRLIEEYDEECSQEYGRETYWIAGQFRDDFDNVDEDGCWAWVWGDEERPGKHWNTADSIGGCNFRNNLDPVDNDYVIEVMRETIEAFRDAWKEHIDRLRMVRAGLCPRCQGSGRCA